MRETRTSGYVRVRSLGWVRRHGPTIEKRPYETFFALTFDPFAEPFFLLTLLHELAEESYFTKHPINKTSVQ